VENPSVFFAASGLLAAALALWVRFWVDRGGGQLSGALIGTAWCYCATLILLAGMALAAGLNLTTESGKVPDEAIGLFMAGLCMTAMAVGESGFHVAYNCWRWVRGDNPVSQIVRGFNFDKDTPKEEKEKKKPERGLMVLGPAMCAGFLTLGFVFLSRGHFLSESSWFPWSVVCFAIAGMALVSVAGFVVGHTFLSKDS
jgi:hypothetical protein